MTRLLVVDDEPDIVELLSASLKYHGYDVASATSGRQAATRAATSVPTDGCSTVWLRSMPMASRSLGITIRVPVASRRYV